MIVYSEGLESATAVQILNYSLYCGALFTCHAVVLHSHLRRKSAQMVVTDSPDLSEAQVIIKRNSHANLLLYQSIQTVAGQLRKF